MKNKNETFGLVAKFHDSLLREQAEYAKKIEARASINIVGNVGFMAIFNADPEEFERITGDKANGHVSLAEQGSRGDYYKARQIEDKEASNALKTKGGLTQ